MRSVTERTKSCSFERRFRERSLPVRLHGIEKKLAITPSFKKYIILGQLLSYLRTQTYSHLLSKKIQRSLTLVTQIHLKNKISSRLVTSEQTCKKVIRLTLPIHALDQTYCKYSGLNFKIKNLRNKLVIQPFFNRFLDRKFANLYTTNRPCSVYYREVQCLPILQILATLTSSRNQNLNLRQHLCLLNFPLFNFVFS